MTQRNSNTYRQAIYQNKEKVQNGIYVPEAGDSARLFDLLWLSAVGKFEKIGKVKQIKESLQSLVIYWRQLAAMIFRPSKNPFAKRCWIAIRKAPVISVGMTIDCDGYPSSDPKFLWKYS